MSLKLFTRPAAILRGVTAATLLSAAVYAAASFCASPSIAQDNVAGKMAKAIADVEIKNKKFEPPEDIRVVTKEQWSRATPQDAYYGIISSMIADNPHWQAEGTVLEMRENVRRSAGGKIGQRVNKALTTQVSRIAIMQIIQRGDAAIVISLKEHRPNWQVKEPVYSSDVFGFEKRNGEWFFNPRRSTTYPGCKVVFLGSIKRPKVDHYYCLVQDADGYFTLDSTIQNDAEFNKAMFGITQKNDEGKKE